MKLYHAQIKWTNAEGERQESPHLLAWSETEVEFREIITRVEPITDDSKIELDTDEFPCKFAPFRTKELYDAAHSVPVTEIESLEALFGYFPDIAGKEFHIVESSGW